MHSERLIWRPQDLQALPRKVAALLGQPSRGGKAACGALCAADLLLAGAAELLAGADAAGGAGALEGYLALAALAADAGGSGEAAPPPCAVLHLSPSPGIAGIPLAPLGSVTMRAKAS